ncbi:trypsin-like serine peptidase [Coleofasciculus sp. F4-SAH-05]|uniref:trypsin-like serine peptidase n=1 Tax=Coleofasciculus sp. F4-SAH-05 TaxID=3069525 RepID=UPI0032F0E3E6
MNYFLKESAFNLANRPTPGNFYRIQKGDTLLKIAGKAYQVKSGTKERLAFARKINRDPLNLKYIRKDKKTKLFTEGLISFYPHFSCDPEILIKAKYKPAKGNCYAIIWIPPKRYNYHSILGQGKPIPISQLDQELQEEEIEFQSNKRQRQRPYHSVNTQNHPYRWICSLVTRFPDPDDNTRLIDFDSGTGLLISQEHVLTAAHILFHQIEGSKGTPAWVKAQSVKIIPGRNGLISSPFGIANASESNIRFHPNYVVNGVIFEQYDYGLLKIETGNNKYKKTINTLGYWGDKSEYKIKATQSEFLNHKILQTSGYPLFRIHHQRRTQGEVKNELIPKFIGSGDFPDLIIHLAPSLPGQSGSPMWLEKKIQGNTIYYLVAINQSGNYQKTEQIQEPRFITLSQFISGLGIVITEDVLRKINEWKRSI